MIDTLLLKTKFFPEMDTTRNYDIQKNGDFFIVSFTLLLQGRYQINFRVNNKTKEVQNIEIVPIMNKVFKLKAGIVHRAYIDIDHINQLEILKQDCFLIQDKFDDYKHYLSELKNG